MSTVAATAPAGSPLAAQAVRAARRNAWVVGLLVLLGVLLLFTKAIQPTFGAQGISNLAIAALPVALAAVGQTFAVLTGGIDLSIGSMMALTSVVAARLMDGASDELAILVVIAVLGLGLLIGAINGALVVTTRVPDIIVTLAMLFVWAGVALLVLDKPGGAATPWLRDLISGTIGSEWLPKPLVVLLVLVGIVCIPLRRSLLGLSIYAVGSNALAAYRSGVSVRRTKVCAYALTGLFAAFGGLALTMSTGTGDRIPGPYLLLSVAAVVLGGVSLAGGRGGIAGPIVAVFILRLVRADLTFIGIDPGYATVIEGAIMIGVVIVAGAAASLRRERA